MKAIINKDDKDTKLEIVKLLMQDLAGTDEDMLWAKCKYILEEPREYLIVKSCEISPTLPIIAMIEFEEIEAILTAIIKITWSVYSVLDPEAKKADYGIPDSL